MTFSAPFLATYFNQDDITRMALLWFSQREHEMCDIPNELLWWPYVYLIRLGRKQIRKRNIRPNKPSDGMERKEVS